MLLMESIALKFQGDISYLSDRRSSAAILWKRGNLTKKVMKYKEKLFRV